MGGGRGTGDLGLEKGERGLGWEVGDGYIFGGAGGWAKV